MKWINKKIVSIAVIAWITWSMIWTNISYADNHTDYKEKSNYMMERSYSEKFTEIMEEINSIKDDFYEMKDEWQDLDNEDLEELKSELEMIKEELWEHLEMEHITRIEKEMLYNRIMILHKHISWKEVKNKWKDYKKIDLSSFDSKNNLFLFVKNTNDKKEILDYEFEIEIWEDTVLNKHQKIMLESKDIVEMEWSMILMEWTVSWHYDLLHINTENELDYIIINWDEIYLESENTEYMLDNNVELFISKWYNDTFKWLYEYYNNKVKDKVKENKNYNKKEHMKNNMHKEYNNKMWSHMSWEKRQNYKKQFKNKLEKRLQKIDKSKLEQISMKIDVVIEKYENKDELSDDEESMLDKLYWLQMLIDDILNDWINELNEILNEIWM